MDDVRRAENQSSNFYRDGGRISDATEFVYDNETVYFAQPSLSQFLPGGSGAGNFNPVSVILAGPKHDAPALTGRNALKSNTGTVLRYAPPPCYGYNSPS